MSRNFTWSRIAFLICAAAWVATGSTARTVADEANAQGTAMPDPAALMHSVEDNQKHLESIQRDYIFRRKEEDQNVDSHGSVKSTDTREYEVHYVAGWEIDRLISKNGKPVSSRKTGCRMTRCGGRNLVR
jgi:hypothetical protein